MIEPTAQLGSRQGTIDRRAPSIVRMLQAGTAAGLLALLVLKVDWKQIAASVLAVDPIFVVGAMVAFLWIPPIEATRLKIATADDRIDWLGCLRLVLVGTFVGSVTPGQLGGDIYRVAAISQDTGRPIRASVAILVIRGFGIVVMAGACLASFILLGADASEALASVVRLRLPPAVWLAIAGMLIITLGVVVLRRTESSTMTEVRQACRALSPGRIAALLIGAGLLVIIRGTAIWLCARSTGFSLPPEWAILAASGGALAMATPITIAGLGVREATIAGLLVVAGMGYEPSLVVAVLCRIPLVGFSLTGGLWLAVSSRSSTAAGKDSSTSSNTP